MIGLCSLYLVTVAAMLSTRRFRYGIGVGLCQFPHHRTPASCSSMATLHSAALFYHGSQFLAIECSAFPRAMSSRGTKGW
jgi:hypothetical protein